MDNPLTIDISSPMTCCPARTMNHCYCMFPCRMYIIQFDAQNIFLKNVSPFSFLPINKKNSNMPDTYSQIHIHIVFAVKFRKSLIGIEWQDELFKYITGIIQNNKHKMLSINCMPDHIHILIGMRPTQSLSDLMQDIKTDSTKWINSRKFLNQRFAWQGSYGAFSYSKSQIHRVMNYIENQQKHHNKQDFISEYKQTLEKFGVDYNENNVFKPLA